MGAWMVLVGLVFVRYLMAEKAGSVERF